jgi:DNA recombination protein RmuC
MDVKFPFDNYRRLIEADGEPERQGYESAFLRDVRDRIKEVATREYVDPEGGTVNYALMFIPNESVYAFIHERDGSVFDESLQMKVVCCSPYMLYAMLALVDQAAKTLSLQKASEELLALYGRFSLEWGKFNGALETLGRRLDSTRKAYDDATGRRKNALQRPLDRIEALREQRGLPIAPGDPILPGDDGMLSLEDAEEEEEEEEKDD